MEGRSGSCVLDSPGSEWGPVADSCEYDNEPSYSIKGKEFLGQLSHCQLVTKESES
jgi:hypothetical protein